MLRPVDLARFCIIYTRGKDIIQTKYFRKRWLEEVKGSLLSFCAEEKAKEIDYQNFGDGNFYCWGCVFRCDACTVQPDLLLKHPQCSDCYCTDHLTVHPEEIECDMTSTGVFSCLTSKIMLKILLYLPSVSCASLAIAFPAFQNILKSWYFIRLNAGRFRRVHSKQLITCLFDLRDNKFESYMENMCVKPHTPSGHCPACMLNPMLLCESSSKTNCYCVDHMFLSGSLNFIRWNMIERCDMNKSNIWPDCGFSRSGWSSVADE